MPIGDPNPQWKGVEPAIRVNQILVGALLAGLLSFSAVVVVLRSTGSLPPAPAGGSNDQVLLLVMAALTVGTLAGGFIMQQLHVGQIRKLDEQGVEMDDRLLMGRYATLLILRAALAEGPALLGTVIVLISGNMLGFAGTAVGAVVLLLIFPTRGKFDSFVRGATGRPPEL